MDLVALEEIKRLKYRYLRCVDTKDWAGVADTLTADATADYGTPSARGSSRGRPLRLGGRDALVAFLADALGPGVVTTHLATHPEIDVSGDDATGRWAFQDTLIAVEHRVVLIGAAFYEDRYRRGGDGRWRIRHTGFERTHEVTLSVDDLPSFRLTANRWAVEPVPEPES